MVLMVTMMAGGASGPRGGAMSCFLRRGLGLMVLAVVGLAGCAVKPALSPVGDDVPTVVATLFPLADITRALADDVAVVVTLVPTGASPHTFELTAQKATAIERSRVIVRVGPGIDDWLTESLDLGGKQVVTALDTTDLLQPTVACTDPDHQHVTEAGHAHGAEEDDAHHDHEGADPHVWLDPLRVRDDIAPAIAEALAKAFPNSAQAIGDRLAAVQAELTDLDVELRTVLMDLPTRAYVAVHPAWTYFDQRYDLKLVATVQEVPGQEPSMRQVLNTVEDAKRGHAGAIFTEAQSSDAMARNVADETGLPVLTLDPLGGEDVAGRDSYADLMRYNANQFAQGLSARAGARAGAAAGRRP